VKNLEEKRNGEQASNKSRIGFMNSTCCVSFATESSSSPPPSSHPSSFVRPSNGIKNHTKCLCNCPHEVLKSTGWWIIATLMIVQRSACAEISIYVQSIIDWWSWPLRKVANSIFIFDPQIDRSLINGIDFLEKGLMKRWKCDEWTMVDNGSHKWLMGWWHGAGEQLKDWKFWRTFNFDGFKFDT
jgi:hypothetical protein